MKRYFYITVDSILIACLALYGVALGSGNGDVSIRLNGGDDVAYIGEDNILEIWIANDAYLNTFSLGFEISYTIGLSWAMDYGDCPPINRENRATNGPYILRTNDFDNVSPDHILMGGSVII